MAHLKRWVKKDVLSEISRCRRWRREDFGPATSAPGIWLYPITECGVFTVFTGFFQNEHQKMKKEQLEAIAALIGRCEADDFLTESAYTCFLENIAGDPPDRTLAPYLSVAAQDFMSHWRPQAPGGGRKSRRRGFLTLPCRFRPGA